VDSKYIFGVFHFFDRNIRVIVFDAYYFGKEVLKNNITCAAFFDE
jgi:hypothetical protein